MQDKDASAIRSGSDLALCLQAVVNDGRALVFVRPSPPGDADALPVLEQLDGFARDEAGLDLPAFAPAAALWAARLFHQLCRFTVCRDIPAEPIRVACAIPCPDPRRPGTDWSADLTLRHLPRLWQLAQRLSNADPLLDQLALLARAWPLSSVGIPRLAELSVGTFFAHPGLRRLYADRIVAANDVSRLADARVAEGLRADLGIHHDLAPALAAKLFPPHESH